MSSLYVLHRDPTTNARMYCDQDVLGMILYYATLLVSAHAEHNDGQLRDSPFGHGWHLNTQKVYTPLESEDTMVQWVAATWGNYRWTKDCLKALLDEYQRRWGDAKGKRHKTWDVYEAVRREPRLLKCKCLEAPYAMTPFPFRISEHGLPRELRGEDVDVVEKYRYLYARKWGTEAAYSNVETPEFMLAGEFPPEVLDELPRCSLPIPF